MESLADILVRHRAMPHTYFAEIIHEAKARGIISESQTWELIKLSRDAMRDSVQ